MSRERRSRIEELFERALERPAGERAAWLAAACGADGGLRAEVEALLAAHERAHGILEADVGAMAETLERNPARGRRIGNYRVIRELGRGGMGVVYLAERDDGQFRRRVAVKILRGGPGGEELRSRFLAERQILASLDHPNIAQLLDGGVSAGALPFLAMEYVEGQPITEYCDRRRLGIDDRLRLFCDVCAAVRHAHQNLVIHRDLKPSNILVTQDGHVKLLDFGIAKLLNPGLSAVDMPVTRTELRIMTPEYASPEQVRGEPLTTASDVYALGVVLYELLAGHSPYPPTSGAPHELSELVCEHEPERPSSRVGRTETVTRGDGRSEEITPERVGRERGEPVGRLRQRLRGDLDAIVLTALRKEPNRRYGSAAEMARDIERFVEGRPIIARGDSAFYRLRKFVSRNRWPVAAAAAALVLLLAYTTTTAVQNRRVRRALAEARLEADRSSQLTDLMLGLFVSGPELGTGADSLAVRTLLERGMSRADQLRQRPAARSQMLGVLGGIHHQLGEFDRAAELLEEALVLARSAFGDRHLSVAEIQVSLAETRRMLNALGSAERLLRDALETERRLLGEEHTRIAATRSQLAFVLRDLGELGQAERLARDALRIRRRLLAEDHPDIAESLHQIGDILRRRGDTEAAGRLFEESLAMQRRLFQGDRLEIADGLRSMGLYHELRGDDDAAERYYRESLDMYRRLVGDRHPTLTALMSSLGLVVGRQGRTDDAAALLTASVELSRRIYGGVHPEVARGLRLVGLNHLRNRAYAEAEPYYRQSLEMLRSLLGEDHLEVGLSLHGLGAALRGMGRSAEAVPHLRQALRIRLDGLNPEHPFIANTRHELGAALLDMGETEQAEAYLVAAFEARRDNLDRADAARSAALLVQLYETLGRLSDADRYRREAARGDVGRAAGRVTASSSR